MTVIDLKTGNETKISDEMSLSCAVGNFDGVHRAHGVLLENAADKGKLTHSAVWTFRTHPRICMGVPDTTILTGTDEKLSLFAVAGLDLAVLCDFPDVSSLSPCEFVADLLYNACRVRRAVCGYNFRFGKNASGNVDDFTRLFGALGVPVIAVPPVRTADGEIISSSLIRRKIEEGDMPGANDLLGRPFRLCLPVTAGQRLGRTMGFPTINQVFPKYHTIPRHGVYATKCYIKGKEFIGVSNVGSRPTVIEHADFINCETHIIGFSGDIYGEKVCVDFYKFIRPEIKFSSKDELARAISADKEKAVSYFK